MLKGTTFTPFGTGYYTTATNARIYVPLTTQMRIAPTLTTSAASTFYYGHAGLNPTAIALYISGTNMYALDATVSGMTIGQGTQLYGDSSGNASLLFTSEL